MHTSPHEKSRKSKRDMLANIADLDPMESRLPMRNTLDYRLPNGERRIRLHNTDILTIMPDSSFMIDTGGWNTMITRDRLNTFLPTPWRVLTEMGSINLSNGKSMWPFLQSIQVHANGNVTPDVDETELVRLRKLIDRYMKRFRERGLPIREESQGDPWIIGSTKVSREVMLDWLESEYVHRTMYVLALHWAGVPDRANKYGGKLDKRDLAWVRRYIRACLGLAI